MELYPNSKVYILCPRGYASGGPESLHQLCLQLRALNVNAFMFCSLVVERQQLCQKNFHLNRRPYAKCSERTSAESFLLCQRGR